MSSSILSSILAATGIVEAPPPARDQASPPPPPHLQASLSPPPPDLIMNENGTGQSKRDNHNVTTQLDDKTGVEVKVRQRRKHVVLTISQKQEVVQAVLNGAKPADVCQKYNLPRSTLFDLVKRRQRLLVFGSDGKINNDSGHRKTMHGARHRKLDYALLKWYTKRTGEGYTVTGPMIKEKAKQFYQELGISTVCKFTSGWLDKFKQRHGLKFQKGKKEKVTLSHDAETIHHFIDDYEDFKEEFMTDMEKTLLDNIKQEPAEDEDALESNTENSGMLDFKTIRTPTHGKITIKRSRKQISRLKAAIKTLLKPESESEVFGKHVAHQLKILPLDLATAAKSTIQEYMTQVKVQENTNFPTSHYVYIDNSQGTEQIHQVEIVSTETQHSNNLESPVNTVSSQDIGGGTITYQTVDMRNGNQAAIHQTLQQNIPIGRIKHIEIQNIDKNYQTDNNTIIAKQVHIQNHQIDNKNYQTEIRPNQMNLQPDIRIHNVDIPNQMNIGNLQTVIRNNLLDINSTHGNLQPVTDIRNHQLNLPNNILDIRNVYMELHKRF